MKRIIKTEIGIDTIYEYVGQNTDDANKWKNICKIDDETERNAQVDLFINEMIANKDKNGFLGPDEEIVIRNWPSQSIKLDDPETYHIFFKHLNKLSDSGKKFTAKIYADAVVNTVFEYFGENSNDEDKRFHLTLALYDKDDNLNVPSIRNLKNQNCAACVEYAALSYNLWTISGKRTHYMCNKEINHAFNLIEAKNYLLFDLAQRSVKVLDFNPVEKIKSNEEMLIDNFTYSKPKTEL